MSLRVLKNRSFARSAEKEGLTDKALCKAAAEIESGLVDARLGGFLLKKRVAKPGRGKRGGFRIIVAHRQGDRLLCLYVFSKNQQDNIDEKELLALSEAGDVYMAMTTARLTELVANGILTEVMYDGEEDKPDP